AVVECAAMGNILREVWKDVGGNNITDNNWTNAPSSSSLISSFEGPTNVADNYASRIRGYLCAPQTGNYTFWIAGDDAVELWLSTDDNPANKRKIAYHVSWTTSREWERYSTQKSAQIYLEAGKKYYIEALHKEGGGEDNVAVAWQLPDGQKEAPISGSHLSPVSTNNHPGITTAISPKIAETNPLVLENTQILIGGEIKVYPNPTGSVASIKIQNLPSGIVTIQLYDLQNRLLSTIFDGFLERASGKIFRFNGSHLPNGMYFIKCIINNRLITEKIIIAR
ncbi:MAG: PA14 domain-containing protein, partial [Bacteroidota bacterium]|nr:PA14 domain-containing protein [Bacteroidota bacterium]